MIVSNPSGRQLIGDTLILADGRLAGRFGPEREALQNAIETMIRADGDSIGTIP